jgi:diguanylate cyclase (GGDEF)-like protein/PAS domain S-box-containing protein
MAKGRILVVEDEVIIARDIQRTLVRIGYEVPALAVSGEDALTQVASLRPDLVLMDIQLSGELDGIATADRIRTRDALPVVFLTAHSDEATLRRAHITEPYGYVLKPFEERELEIAVDIALYRHTIETKLRNVERWLTTTLRSIGDAVIATDRAGTITFINHVAETITGWSPNEAIGRPFGQVLRLVQEETRAPVESLVERVLRDEVVIELAPNTVLIARDGAELPVDDSAAPIRDESGAITGVVIIFRDITARKQVERQLRHLALHDPLTGLPNRALLMDRLALAFEHTRRYPDHRYAVLYLDLDRFKVINDSLGHLAGDQLLVGVARRLSEDLRAVDTIARLGGDEFAILINGIVDTRDALHIAERILQSMSLPMQLGGHEIHTTVSIGIALSAPGHERSEDILRDADTALYRAKGQGKARYSVFDAELHQRALDMLRLEIDLRRAIERDEFRLYYQPIYALADGRLSGFEALIRWQHPERGLLAPDLFLPLAEEAGLLLPIERWVLRRACEQLREWQGGPAASTPLTMSVNLSNTLFVQPNVAQQVAQILAETGVEPGWLCLEITETVIARQDTTARTLAELDVLGAQLHIDDFGTGYSSLSKLHRTPIDVLKIDRAFVRRLEGPQGEEHALVRTILLLARELGMAVVAEGVETAEQAALLRSMACDYGQGYWFAKPLDRQAATLLVQGHHSPQ